MASVQDLRDLFESFCSFGSNRNLATGSSSNLSGDMQMDNARFSKFCKDCKVIEGKKITSTDVDILFNKIKTKGARKITWVEFQEAFATLAEMRYPSKNARDAYQSLLHVVSNEGPVARATITKTNGVYSKLTDTKQYTGSHKNRFDENGVGKGAAGRDYGQATLNHSQVVNRSSNNNISSNTYSSRSLTNISGPSNNTSVGASKKRGQTSVVTASVETLEIKSKPSKKVDAHSSTGKLNKGSTSSLNARPATSGYSTKKSSGSVFDRLTDTSGYTGSHAHRFNADGTGKGLTGRETVRKGNGSTSQDGLARILRA
ncbi:MAG: hypothetical protein SGCHY_001031 [Lobulomycetales sp.]